MRYLVSTLLLFALLSAGAASVQQSLESARRITPDEASQLVKKGKAVIVEIKNAAALVGGYNAWAKAGYPTAKGE